MSMRVLLSFLFGMACGAAAMICLSGRWPASLLLNAGPLCVADAVAVGTSVRSPQTVSVEKVAIQPTASVSVVRTAVPMPAMTLTDAAMSPALTVPQVPAPAAVVPVDRLPSAVAGLLIPVVGVKPADLVDTFSQARGAGRTHDAIDIMAPRGTPVVAANEGHVVKLFTSKPGGLTVYEFDSQDKVVYYYAHLDRYAPGLVEGQLLHRGDPVGFVGSTGDASANAPHLHFEVQLLGPEKQWWHGTSINPYGRFEGQ
jgi:murein DD-endopeptidase MepM/ murein hydrolase activator NlpD